MTYLKGNMTYKLINELKDSEKLDDVIEQANSQEQVTSGASLNRRVYTPKKVETRIARYEEERALREHARKNAVSFIHDEFDAVYKLTQGLVLVLGVSGKGKSTTVGNIIAQLLKTKPGASAMVISNEELSDAVYNRIACVILGYSFKQAHENKLKPDQNEALCKMVEKIANQVEVVEGDGWDMTYLEDVQAVLEYAASKKIKMVVIDYLQTVAFSREKPHLESYQVSKILGLYLKDYGKRLGIPVIVFAQLRPRSESPDIQSRIQNDKTIFNHAFDCIELEPDFKLRTTKFTFHKNRFGDAQGKEITMKFVDGQYVSLDDI